MLLVSPPPRFIFLQTKKLSEGNLVDPGFELQSASRSGAWCWLCSLKISAVYKGTKCRSHTHGSGS